QHAVVAPVGLPPQAIDARSPAHQGGLLQAGVNESADTVAAGDGNEAQRGCSHVHGTLPSWGTMNGWHSITRAGGFATRSLSRLGRFVTDGYIQNGGKRGYTPTTRT